MNFEAILRCYDKQEVEVMRHNFRLRFDAKCREEKEFCAKNHVEPRMTDETARHILGMLERCANAYYVQCLERFVIHNMEIPTWDELEEAAWEMSNRALKED